MLSIGAHKTGEVRPMHGENAATRQNIENCFLGGVELTLLGVQLGRSLAQFLITVGDEPIDYILKLLDHDHDLVAESGNALQHLLFALLAMASMAPSRAVSPPSVRRIFLESRLRHERLYFPHSRSGTGPYMNKLRM